MNDLCALYLRVSTDYQADHGVSLPAQKSRLTAYCKAQGWDLYKIYIDDGYSGKNLDRPAMKQLLKDAKQYKFNHIAVIKLDRLSRSQKDALYLIEDIFTQNDISFHSVSESFDTNTPFGKASLGMLSVFAQLEREMIVDRIITAKKECAKQGRYLGGFIPYGYTYDQKQKKYVIEPITARTVRLIFDAYQTGEYSFGGIAELLDNKKIPTMKGGKYWDKTTIRQILINPAYAGKVRHKGQIYNGKHDGIVLEEQFETVNKMVKKRYVKQPTKDDENLLTGMIYCGECGSRMRYKKQNWNTVKNHYSQQYYVCYTQYGYNKGNCDCGFKKVQELNQAVVDYLFSLANSPCDLDDKIKKAIASIDNNTSSNDEEIIKNELSKISSKITRWYDAYENGDIESNQLSDRTRSLRNQQTELESQISIIEESKNIKQQRILSSRVIKELLLQFPQQWEYITAAERRALLAKFISKITVSKDDNINIEFLI